MNLENMLAGKKTNKQKKTNKKTLTWKLSYVAILYHKPLDIDLVSEFLASGSIMAI